MPVYACAREEDNSKGIPFAPHLLFTQFLDDAQLEERRLGLHMGVEMLRLCDALWAFGEPTQGMQAEMRWT